MNYPRRIFHEIKKPFGMIVNNEKEEKALGSGWVESPNDYSEAGRAKVEFPPTEPDSKSLLEVGEPVKEQELQKEGELPADEEKSPNPPKALEDFNEAELKAILVEKHGYKKNQLNRKSKEVLLEMIRKAE